MHEISPQKACTIMIRFNTVNLACLFPYIINKYALHIIDSKNGIIHQKILNVSDYPFGCKPSHIIRNTIIWLQKCLGQVKEIHNF